MESLIIPEQSKSYRFSQRQSEERASARPGHAEPRLSVRPLKSFALHEGLRKRFCNLVE